MISERAPHRLALTADLHYGITPHQTIKRLVTEIAAAECDAVCIAGDIGEPESNFQAALELFATLDIPCGVVAGNHDVWAGTHSSQELWESVLPRITADVGATWLEGENVVLGSLGICGTIGWYDYSAADPRLAEYDADRYQRQKSRFNMDGIHINWPYTDREFSRQILQAFRRRIKELQDNPAISAIAVITHVPPFEEQIIRKSRADFLWNVNNAYFGNLTLGEEISRRNKTTLVASGHTHVGVDAHVNRTGPNGPPIRVLTIGSAYRTPRHKIIEIS